MDGTDANAQLTFSDTASSPETKFLGAFLNEAKELLHVCQTGAISSFSPFA
ncbi:hypothetical protein BQ8482_910010 [Mesorhizobium delmotii]|uniref:Uncharacterized protein n=1 Tax=Mesorhizobium delmotii TaxID=1631247 RepID=A0A2P9AXV1_9HYPH|nr:hypothetical protein BQ8482_910010 [Mesorhizobium delmotii]